MKRFIYIFLIILLLPIKINASYDAYITGDYVRVRDNHTTDSNVITSLNSSTSISVVDKTLYEGNGCDSKWYKIIYGNTEGYVCSRYVAFNNSSYNGISVVDYTARINTNNVSVRKGTSVSTQSQDVLSLGVNVTVLDSISGSKTNCSSGIWYKVSYYSNKTGYVCSNYINKKSDITDTNYDSDYLNYLKNEGFPESYYPYLNYLHKIHPTWVFKAGKTNLDFTVSVNSEEGKNYMQTNNDSYRVSSNPVEGNSWFTVNSGVIAFYLDPRNFLTEDRIFMFESLSYDSSLEQTYPALVKSIFGSGALSDDKYVIPIINAGKANKISPIHIASRIKQEVSANGSDSTNGGEFTWKGQKYSGYYNFFNIGAFETTIDGVSYSSVTRGLAYAAKLVDRDGSVWNNIETAITEGSSFLAQAYITLGQGSLYYQKFNVGPNAYYNKFTHQYMTNIQAPATEGASTYYSYLNSGLIEQARIFEIPVYNNMPAYTSLPSSGSTNNNLSLLEVENYSLTPSFDKDVLSYEVYVPNSINNIKINAKCESDTASISGTGEKELKDDTSIYTIVVLSESGEEKKYTLTIKKTENSTNVQDIISKLNVTVKDNLIVNIKRDTSISDIRNNVVKNGGLSAVINTNNSYLSTGNKLTINAGVESKTYTISVTGDTSGDGKITILDLLQVQKHLIGASKLNDERLYAADTSKDGNVTILDLLQIQKYLKGEKDL